MQLNTLQYLSASLRSIYFSLLRARVVEGRRSLLERSISRRGVLVLLLLCELDALDRYIICASFVLELELTLLTRRRRDTAI